MDSMYLCLDFNIPKRTINHYKLNNKKYYYDLQMYFLEATVKLYFIYIHHIFVKVDFFKYIDIIHYINVLIEFLKL